MKPGGQLQRRTRLERTTPPKPGAGGLSRHAAMKPGKGLKRSPWERRPPAGIPSPRCAKPTVSTKRQQDTGPTKKTRDLVKKRARWCCEICGHHIGSTGGHIHHRQPRGIGGSSDPGINLPGNLLYLDDKCHGWLEGPGRAQAYRLGHLVRRPTVPAGRVVHLRVGVVRLDNLGGYKLAGVA